MADSTNSPIRRRITFLVDVNDPDTVNSFSVSKDGKSMTVKDNKSPRHHRVTIPQSRQSPELRALLNNIKFQINWSNLKPYNKNIPFKVPRETGLHIEATLDSDWNSIQSILSQLGIKNNTSIENTVVTDNWRSLYIENFDPLHNFDTESAEIFKIFTNSNSYQPLNDVDSITISNGLTPQSPLPYQLDTDLIIESYTHLPKDTIPPLVIKKSQEDNQKIEVGLLHTSIATDEEEWTLEGLVRDFDKPSKPIYEKIMVRYPKQHRQTPTDSSYTGEFAKPVGLHPKYHLHLTGIESPGQFCRLYSKYTIPKSLFVDKYQLVDLDRSTTMTPAKGKLIAVWGETDLEAPIWSVNGWGSELLVEIYHNNHSSEFTFELPLHSRYGIPQLNATSVSESLPWPIVFWVCPDFQREERNIAEIKGLGYESLFPDNTLYYHLTPKPTPVDDLTSRFEIPVAPFNHYDRIQWFSITVLLTATLYILYKIFSNIRPKKKSD